MSGAKDNETGATKLMSVISSRLGASSHRGRRHYGEAVQVYFRVEQDRDTDCTWFYLDTLEYEVRTEWPIPAPVPGAVSIGGRVLRLDSAAITVTADRDDVDLFLH